MDDIEDRKCWDYERRIHYIIDDTFVCLPESLPEHILLQCRLLIEIFGFENSQPCEVGLLQCLVDDNYLLYFNIDEQNLQYILELQEYGLVIKGESKNLECGLLLKFKNFDDVIRYIDKYYPDLRIVPIQKLVQNYDT